MYEFEDYIFEIKKTDEVPKHFPKDSNLKAFIEIDKIDFVLRHRRNGDMINPLGSVGSQKIKKYLNEKKIPQHEKNDIVFLCNGKEVFWAAGIGISEKIKVTNKPTHIITLKKR